MKTLALAAAMLTAATGASFAASLPTTATGGQVTIVASCYRGPWREVIWDRPNAVFFDSLVAAGYSQPDARAIADRICKDALLVGNMEAMLPQIKAVIAAAPRNR